MVKEASTQQSTRGRFIRFPCTPKDQGFCRRRSVGRSSKIPFGAQHKHVHKVVGWTGGGVSGGFQEVNESQQQLLYQNVKHSEICPFYMRVESKKRRRERIISTGREYWGWWSYSVTCRPLTHIRCKMSRMRGWGWMCLFLGFQQRQRMNEIHTNGCWLQKEK